MVLAEAMLEFCRDGSLSRICGWHWALKCAQILGERHSLSMSADEQAQASKIKPYSMDQPKRTTQPHSRTLELGQCDGA